jgi:hypothetical protein
LRKERISRNFLNVLKIKRSDAYKTNFSKKMMHQDEELPHQKWTDGVASPRKGRQKPMIMRVLGSLGPRGNVVLNLYLSLLRAMMKTKAKVITRLVTIINLRVYAR